MTFVRETIVTSCTNNSKWFNYFLQKKGRAGSKKIKETSIDGSTNNVSNCIPHGKEIIVTPFPNACESIVYISLCQLRIIDGDDTTRDEEDTQEDESMTDEDNYDDEAERLLYYGRLKRNQNNHQTMKKREEKKDRFPSWFV